MTDAIISYDIGGTKIRSGLVLLSGQLVDWSETSSKASDGPSGIRAAAESLTKVLLARNVAVNICAGAVSTGGVVDKQQGTIGAAATFMPGWSGYEIEKAFQSLVGHKVFVNNDGNCALFAEVKVQKLEEWDTVMLALGTGLGGALYLNGSIRRGSSALAGHFGQTLVGGLSSADEWEQLETFLSGSGLAKLAQGVAKERDRSADSSKLFPDGHAVISALSFSDIATTALSRWVRLLARTCHNIQWSYDPDAIVIGGGMIEAKSIWWPRFEQALQGVNERFRLPCRMDVRPACLGNDAAMLGAGLIAWTKIKGHDNEP